MHTFHDQRQRILDLYRDSLQSSEITFGERVKRVVFVVCSPRSGSSLLASILRNTDQLLSFQGAITPFLALEDLRYPYSGNSDSLDATHLAVADDLNKHLEFECGTASDDLSTESLVADFAEALTVRLGYQWPEIAFSPEVIRGEVEVALRVLEAEHGWPKGYFVEPTLFHAVFLKGVINHYPSINPYFYDLDPKLIGKIIPHASIEAHSPREKFLEMPPLILIRPWKRATSQDVSEKIVVMKTVGNTFRLPFWKAFFPNAEFKIFHLTRSVAASVNGMYDGWHHRGFWCARTLIDLNIPGYSDVYEEWGSQWWKFGLFPGWENYINAPVEEIAAAHWRACHNTILDWLASNPDQQNSAIRVHFEDVVGDSITKEKTYQAIADWFGIALDDSLKYARDNDMPLQLATVKPAPQRWKERSELLAPVIEDSRNRVLMQQLGYSLDTSTW